MKTFCFDNSTTRIWAFLTNRKAREHLARGFEPIKLNKSAQISPSQSFENKATMLSREKRPQVVFQRRNLNVTNHNVRID
jgi:hypothetical protein